eukprot:CAMPEP_0172448894 /NCGR_PEP_ID=MMETSP1065-20121228/7789_1 /TAXON_ID=265537 /ORGANISM="Amphiprora paludosa, Strain CCMP125" /LENGTH=350 /DNA_ID=CAMNT_0013200485 /DNA_START=219 /DNA_END=1271 /DNA_ORIENTATION=+
MLSSSSRLLRHTATRWTSSAAASRWASILVVSESSTPELLPATQSAVTAAQQFGSDHDIVLVTAGSQGPPTQIPQGVSSVHHCTVTSNVVTPETWALAIQQATEAATDAMAVIGTSSKTGSSVLPRAAALLNVSPISDVLQVVDADTFIRPMYAGNALAKVQVKDTMKDSLKMLTIRPTSFEKAPLVDAATVTVQEHALEEFADSSFVSANVSQSDRPDLTAAATVVSGGRGLKEGANFAMLETLVDALAAQSTTSTSGGAVGASRAAVDAGMVPNDWQVGQTGKVVAPDLYVAVGISGAIQHLSGMKDSKTIVAINSDPEAPIFQVADYGLVADLFQAVPELTTKLESS